MKINKKILIIPKILCGLFFSLISIYAQSSEHRGTVTDKRGAAISGATVSISNSPPPVTFNFQTFTDETGVYLFSAPPGSYTVRVQVRGFKIREGVVTLGIGAASTFDFVLDDEIVDPGLFKGSVTANKTTISNARVTVLRKGDDFAKSVTTDATGKFEITNLRAGDYSITIEVAGYKKLTVNEKIKSGKTLLKIFKLKKAD